MPDPQRDTLHGTAPDTTPDTTPARLATVRRYLAALHASDTATLVDCFEPQGQVHSPFLGTVPAPEFFPRLAQASQRSVITVLDLFCSVPGAEGGDAPEAGGGLRVAAWFRYDWTLQDGRELTFTCVDVFSFAAGSTRIAQMHICYDTHPLREQVGDKYAPRPAVG